MIKFYKLNRYTISFYLGILIIVLFYRYLNPIFYNTYLYLKNGIISLYIYEKYERAAETRLIPFFNNNEIHYPPNKITLIALKEERVLELWAANNQQFKLIKKYPFTAFSGKLGPKLRNGDGQIPEGLYKIVFLNPNSNYHLSMKINYPNEFDLAMAKFDGRNELGGDIFIHGKSVTIGCIPVGDEAIEELFTLVNRSGHQNTEVIIAPYDMRIKTLPIKTAHKLIIELYHNIKDSISIYDHTKQLPLAG